MIDSIIKLNSIDSEFSIEAEKSIFIKHGGCSLSSFWQNKSKLSKKEVITLIETQQLTRKDELLAILFWGIYFTVISSSNGNTVKRFIQFINDDNFENEFNKRVNEIIKSNSPSELFTKFQKELKIPGLDYAYFTKLFFFYRIAYKKEPYLILDKWLSKAWCALDGFENKNTNIYDVFFKSKTNHFFDGLLKRKKSQAYSQYLTFMKSITNKKNIDLIELEERLFGADLKKIKIQNPRILYNNWATENKIPIKKYNTNSIKYNLTKSSGLIEFYINRAQKYIGLYTDSNFRSKEGYIDFNGWLCVSDKLKAQLLELNWKEGNTKGGSKEKFKFKFNSENECIQFLNERFKLNFL